MANHWNTNISIGGDWNMNDFLFPNSWDDDPIGRSHILSEGLKPPIRYVSHTSDRLYIYAYTGT